MDPSGGKGRAGLLARLCNHGCRRPRIANAFCRARSMGRMEPERTGGGACCCSLHGPVDAHRASGLALAVPRPCSGTALRNARSRPLCTVKHRPRAPLAAVNSAQRTRASRCRVLGAGGAEPTRLLGRETSRAVTAAVRHGRRHAYTLHAISPSSAQPRSREPRRRPGPAGVRWRRQRVCG